MQSKPFRPELEFRTIDLKFIYSHGNHWIVGCDEDKVNVYDSVYCTRDEVTKQVVFIHGEVTEAG